MDVNHIPEDDRDDKSEGLRRMEPPVLRDGREEGRKGGGINDRLCFGVGVAQSSPCWFCLV